MKFLTQVMGVPMSIDARAVPREVARAASVEAFAVLRDAERRFSSHLPESEVSRLDRGALRLADASPELIEVLEIAERFSRASGGAFGVESPDGSLDLDGVVKGWAAQRAAESLARRGVRSFCLNAGGDVTARGEAGPGVPWQVAVRSPWDPSETLVVLPLRDGAIATSGTYERGEHVRDGRTGLPATDLVSVTVVADDLVTADVLATTVLAMGPDGVGWAVQTFGCGVLAVDAAGALVRMATDVHAVSTQERPTERRQTKVGTGYGPW